MIERLLNRSPRSVIIKRSLFRFRSASRLIRAVKNRSGSGWKGLVAQFSNAIIIITLQPRPAPRRNNALLREEIIKSVKMADEKADKSYVSKLTRV